MGKGTKKNPYAREDVLRRIKRNGGTARGLDLADKYFEEDIDLRGLDLAGIDLSGSCLIEANLEGARLDDAILLRTKLTVANLEGANLSGAYLHGAILHGALLGGASFRWAQLGEQFNYRGADLSSAHLEGADFTEAYLGGVNLEDTEIPHNVNLEEVYWGENYILDEEKSGFLDKAEVTYRRLKTWYAAHGKYGIAGKFYYREKEVGRKRARRWNDRVAGWLSWAFFGYGEGWKRILIWIAAFILLFALIYFAIGTLTPNTVLNSLYYSAASFITLGYGSWVQEATGWVKGLGVFEAFLGFFTMTLLLVTFVRKWIR